MWTYQQSTGFLNHNNVRVAICYAGKGLGWNNPDAQDQHNVGPLPRGQYTILAPVDTKTHGPFVMWLTPDPKNDMQGRSSFGIHDDRRDFQTNPHQASEGCIIALRPVREKIWNSGDRQLLVVR